MSKVQALHRESIPSIFLVIDSLDVGGAERSTMLIAQGLRVRGFRPTIVTLIREGLLAAEARSLGLDTVHLGARGVLDGVGRLRRLIRVRRPTLIHSVLLKSDLVSRIACRLEGVPCVGSIVSDAYGPERYASLTSKRKLGLALVQAADGATAGLIDSVVSISEAVRGPGCASRSIAIEKSVLIPRGRPTEWFQERRLSATPHFLCVARMVKGKGHADLIRAFKALPDGTGMELWFAGDGPLRGELESSTKDLHSVRLLGRRDDVPSLLAGADVVVFPSHSEGQGGVVVEAMLAGAPLVATTIPPVLEHMNEERGRLFAPGDIANLTRQMLAACNDPVEGLRRARNARAYAEAHLSATSMVDAHASTYRRIIGKI